MHIGVVCLSFAVFIEDKDIYFVTSGHFCLFFVFLLLLLFFIRMYIIYPSRDNSSRSTLLPENFTCAISLVILFTDNRNMCKVSNP